MTISQKKSLIIETYGDVWKKENSFVSPFVTNFNFSPHVESRSEKWKFAEKRLKHF